MATRVRLHIATANPKKVEELSRLVPDWVELVPRPAHVGEVEETAPTLEGNAYLKAVEVANAVRDWAIADDTGLFVDALDGAPGVHSARYAGPGCDDAANRAKLMAALTPSMPRGATFRTVVALVHSSGEMHHLVGECRGSIATVESGGNGFGYDSVFIPAEGDGRTFAEMPPGDKDVVSHRRRAMEQLPGLLARIFGSPTA